jgi:hypothetical protein
VCERGALEILLQHLKAPRGYTREKKRRGGAWEIGLGGRKVLPNSASRDSRNSPNIIDAL